MKKFILFSIILSALSSTVISCGSPPKKETDSSSTTPEVPADGIYEDAVLYLQISTKWEAGTEVTTHGTCQIRSNSPLNSEIDCDISVPEGQLYYSAVNFTVGTKLAALCTTLNFYPYYYRIDASDTDYFPPGEKEPAKCSTEIGSNKKCWGGAAPHLVPDFPSSDGVYFMPPNGPQKTFTLESGNSLRWTAGRNNYSTVNNMLLGSRGTARPGRYTANSMSDYVITCEDLWAHPIYTINLNLTDEDTETTQGVQDEVRDWQ